MFNKEAGALMEIKPGDKVTLAQDEESPENWYFFKDKQHGFDIRANKAAGCIFNHKGLINAFLESWGLPKDKTCKCLVAGQPTIMKGDKAQTKYWGILIRPSV